MKLIFLDIDGVLVTEKSKDPTVMDVDKVALFNNVCKKTGAKVVLSSSWRLNPSWRDVMKENGLTCEFLDRTPTVNGSKLTRGAEIHSYLLEHNLYIINDYPKSRMSPLSSYAILDDDGDFMYFQRKHLFKTTWKDGLTKDIAEKLIRHLI